MACSTDDLQSHEDVDMDWCPFWVQAFGLPLGLMNEKIGTVLGGTIGKVMEVYTCANKSAWGESLRIRIAFVIKRSYNCGALPL